MTESDERTIYEWAIPELKGDDWKMYGDLDDCGTYRLDAFRDGKPLLPLPALDMNFAFDVCIPRLVSEGVTVTYLGCLDSKNISHHEWCFQWDKGTEIDAETELQMPLYGTTPVVDDFYAALLAYIKGVK